MSDHIKLYEVHRRIEFVDGSAVVIPVAGFENEEEASAFVQEATEELSAMMLAVLTDPVDGERFPMNVQAFLKRLGAVNLQNTVVPVKVKKESQIVMPRGARFQA